MPSVARQRLENASIKPSIAISRREVVNLEIETKRTGCQLSTVMPRLNDSKSH